MGSLMDGIEVADAKQKAVKAAAEASGSAKTIKLAVAIGGLVVGGTLIAWNLGAFGKPAPPALPPQNVSAQADPSKAPPVIRRVDPPRALNAQTAPPPPTNQMVEQSTR